MADKVIETDADVLRICEASLQSRYPGGYGTQVKRIYELAGRAVPDQVIHKLDCFYFTGTVEDAIDFGRVVREARRRVDEQDILLGWMAL